MATTPHFADTPKADQIRIPGLALLELPILAALAQTDHPVGATTVRDSLRNGGYEISDPSVGRYMHEFDARGYTRRASNRGRELTSAGRLRLTQLRRQETRAAQDARFRELLSPSTLKEIIDILAVRRSLECLSCREAALRATPEQVEGVRAFVASRRPSGDMPGFHSYLSAVSGNALLSALVDLLTRQEALHQTLRSILGAQGSLADMQFHEAVVEAVERHDADAAEVAVVEHFDRMIAAVAAFASSAATDSASSADETTDPIPAVSDR